MVSEEDSAYFVSKLWALTFIDSFDSTVILENNWALEIKKGHKFNFFFY